MIADQSLRDFAQALASRQPVPGGGSASGYVGVLGAALAGMAVAYSHSRKELGDEDRRALTEAGTTLAELQEALLAHAEEDCRAYAAFSGALKLPKGTDEEKKFRKMQIRRALEEAMAVPRRAAALCVEGLVKLAPLCPILNPNLMTDAGVAARCFRAAFEGCWYNVMVNARSMRDHSLLAEVEAEKKKLEQAAREAEKTILQSVEATLQSA
jgi:formiminotetrahydrofolate cyclodeaminase